MLIEGTTHQKGTDTDLARRVKIFLSTRHQPGLRHLHIETDGGVVTLRGRVNSFYEKQLSYQCCRRVAGVFEIIDLVDVHGTEMKRIDQVKPSNSGVDK